MEFYVCVFVCFLFLEIVSASSGRGSGRDTRSRIPIGPIVENALTLEEFEEFGVNTSFLNLYQASPYGDSTDFTLFSVFGAPGNSSFYLSQSFVSPLVEGLCLTELDVARPLRTCAESSSVEKASLYNNRTDKLTILFSECPSSYLILFECARVSFSDVQKIKTCAAEDTTIYIYVSLTEEEAQTDIELLRPDDVLWYNIVMDLYKTTGIKFGSKGWNWKYTYAVFSNCIQVDT